MEKNSTLRTMFCTATFVLLMVSIAANIALYYGDILSPRFQASITCNSDCANQIMEGAERMAFYKDGVK